MNLKRTTLVFSSLFVFTLLSTVRADVSRIQLIAEAKTNSLDSIVDQSHGYMKWSNGAFIYEDSGVAGIVPIFHTLDREGRLISSSTLKVPGAERVWPGDFDRAVDGSIVFSGGAYSPSGEEAPFIALVSPDGSASTIIRTAPYYPYTLSLAPDGTIWTIGLEMINHDPKAVGLDPNAGVLRHYDRQGRLLASGIEQSRFIGSNETHRLVAGMLVAKGDRIGWISGLDRHGVYSEISPKTLTVVQTSDAPFKDGSHNLIAGFTLTDSGRALLCVETHKDGRASRVAYVFDRTSGTWGTLAVPFLDGARFAPHLMGSDGEQLVFQFGQSAAFFKVSE